MKNKTICVFSSNFYPYTGGLERYVHNFSKFLAKKGYKVYLITSNTLNAPEREEFEGISIIRLPVFPALSGRMPLPKFNADFFRILREIKSIQGDYYIANMRFYFTSLLCAAIGKKRKKPVILIDHITGHMVLGNRLLDKISEIYDHLLTKYLKSKVDIFFGVSKAVCRWLGHFGIKTDNVVYNGIDPLSLSPIGTDYRKKYGLNDETVIFTFAGRLIREKGAAILAKAFNLASKECNDIFLFIAGVGPIFDELKADSQSTKNIVLTGELNQSEIFGLLSETDVVCVPSYFTEGMPTLILEGGLHKCAVIATPMGGATEAVIDAEHGIIVAPKDVIALKNAIISLAKNKALRQNLAEKLHYRVVNYFDWQDIIDIFAERLESTSVKQ